MAPPAPARRIVSAAYGLLAAAGGLAATVRARRDVARERSRFALLIALSDIADGRLALEETAERLGDLLVPELADVCILDVGEDGRLRRLAVRASGPDAHRLETRLRARRPTRSEHPGSGSVARTGQAQLLDSPSDAILRAGAHDDEDLALLRALQINASIVVPLRARGRTLGALTLIATRRTRRTYRADDVTFVELLAGRIGMALDNAGLFSELQTVEAQRSAALGALSEAVTIQNAHGDLIYANAAGAAATGFASPGQMLEHPTDEIIGRYDLFHEDGRPLDPADFPGRRVLAGEDPQPVVMRVVDRETGEQYWRRVQASAIRDRDGRLTMVVNVFGDITAAKRGELLLRLLADVGEALAASLDHHQTLQRVAELCVPHLADWCAFNLPDEHGRLRLVAIAHDEPEALSAVRRLEESLPLRLDGVSAIARVFREGATHRANDMSDDLLAAAAGQPERMEALRRLGTRALLAAPMTTGGRTIGVLTLATAASRRSFSTEDAALAEELARRAASAVEHSRLNAERLAIAETLQTSLLPEPLPALRGWPTATLYRPAGDQNRVGGDFYDAFSVGDACMLVVGDVTGRGAPAAALTALMRHTLRTAAIVTGSPARALETLNRTLLARDRPSLCTAACVVLRTTESGALAEIICAGHPLPVLIRNGAAAFVGRFGPMLGAFPDEEWDAFDLPLAPGDVLVLYSDGVLDAVGPEDRFGPDRLQAALAGATGAEDAVNRIERALAAFQAGPQADDTAVLAVQRVPAPEGV